MNTITKTLLATALAAATLSLVAQDGQRPQRRQGGPGGPDGQGRPHMVPPIVAALDANHDGVIDAAEIANASAALKTLDKDGDGKLSAEELRPARPEGARGEEGSDAPRAPRGPKGPRGPQPPAE